MPTSVIGLRSSGSTTLDSAERTADSRAPESWGDCWDITRECMRSRQLAGPGIGPGGGGAGAGGAGAGGAGAPNGTNAGGGGGNRGAGGGAAGRGAAAGCGVRQNT